MSFSVQYEWELVKHLRSLPADGVRLRLDRRRSPTVPVMTRPPLLPDTWHSRDLPVLVEAVRHFDAVNQPLSADTLAETLGWDVEAVMAAVRALDRGGYVTTMRGAEAPESWVGAVSADAYRAAGAWPSPDTAADRLLAALQAAVDKAPEGSEAKTRARRLLDGLLAAAKTSRSTLPAAWSPVRSQPDGHAHRCRRPPALETAATAQGGRG